MAHAVSMFKRYTPIAVRLPENGSLARDFFNSKQHLPGHDPLDASDYSGYDRYFVFYDVFLDAQGGYLAAIGPRMVNLKKALLPVKVTVSDIANKLGESDILPGKIKEQHRFAKHTFKLPAQYRNATELRVKMQLGNGQEIEKTAYRQQLKPVTLQFSTLQKNNPVKWNIDWLRYCQSIGVERVLLYDNGSDNIDELELAIAAESLTMEVVLIDWPYPYGPKRSHYNYFCQAAQNNHTYLCFGNAEWTGHFDIDEFLIGNFGTNLAGYVKSFPRWIGLLRFDSYLFPNVRDASVTEPTVRDFSCRANTLHNRAHKYIVRNQALRLAKTHNGKVKLGYWRKAINPSQAVFYHYMGLTINWRGNDPRQHIVQFDSAINVEDRRIIEYFAALDQAEPSAY